MMVSYGRRPTAVSNLEDEGALVGLMFRPLCPRARLPQTNQLGVGGRRRSSCRTLLESFGPSRDGGVGTSITHATPSSPTSGRTPSFSIAAVMLGLALDVQRLWSGCWRMCLSSSVSDEAGRGVLMICVISICTRSIGEKLRLTKRLHPPSLVATGRTDQRDDLKVQEEIMERCTAMKLMGGHGGDGWSGTLSGWSNQRQADHRAIRGDLGRFLHHHAQRRRKLRRRGGWGHLIYQGAAESEMCRFRFRFDAIMKTSAHPDCADR